MIRRSVFGTTIVSALLLGGACTSENAHVPAGSDAGLDGGNRDGALDAPLACPAQRDDLVVPVRPLRILFVTKETLFFHAAAHAAGDVAMPTMLRARGHDVTVSNDSSYFAGTALLAFDVIVFFVTSGNVVHEPAQREALTAFVHAGRGVVGVHTASATDNDWLFMYEMIGATFAGHGQGDAQITPARIDIKDPASPLTSFLPNPWERSDEWYFYNRNPMENKALRPLLMLDESSLDPYRPLYPDAGFYGSLGHPLAWTQDYQCSRVFYTALGHTGEAYAEDAFLKFLTAGIEWSGAPVSARPSR